MGVLDHLGSFGCWGCGLDLHDGVLCSLCTFRTSPPRIHCTPLDFSVKYHFLLISKNAPPIYLSDTSEPGTLFFPLVTGSRQGMVRSHPHYDVRIGNPGRHIPIVQHRAAAWATKQSQMAGYFGVKAMGPKAHQCSLLCLVLDTGSRPSRSLPIRKTSANWRSLKCRLLCDAWRRSPPSDAAAADVGAHSEAG